MVVRSQGWLIRQSIKSIRGDSLDLEFLIFEEL